MKDSTPIPGVEGQLPHFMINRGAARSPSINVTLTRARLDQESDDRCTTGELFGKTLTGERDTAHRVVPYRNPSHLPQNKPRDGSRLAFLGRYDYLVLFQLPLLNSKEKFSTFSIRNFLCFSQLLFKSQNLFF